MLKKLILTGIATLTLSNVFAQDKNTVYMEMAGVGLLYSFNYERNITDKITARIGYSAVPIGDDGVSVNSIPIMANYLLGGGNHKLALSGGVSMISLDADTEFGGVTLGSTTAKVFGGGYRYHRMTGGFFLNLSTYMINLGDIGSFATAGMGLGWTF
ncbi:MAG: hypothetical protein HN782_04595 [Candidatus Marinimicrobia bacterium]|nr:hypothetical protein [Candidatus Neomarinimicrobiota bacterium]